MATPWDRAAVGYLEEWVPRFEPYHTDLIRELVLAPGQRALVTCCGPGSEVLAVARAVGETGRVKATDQSAEMVAICKDRAAAAGFGWIDCAAADASDASGGPWDAIICAFGLWQFEDRTKLLERWSLGLAQHGKIGVITWGPPAADDPFEMLQKLLRELEPEIPIRAARIDAERAAMEAMFDAAGLSMVRLTVTRHTLSFASAEAFVRALREACTWRRIWEEIGDVRMERVAAKFYDAVGGPMEPLSFAPVATIALAAHPGDEVELAHRPSVRAPPASAQAPRGSAKSAPPSKGGGE
jgi:ubiquinone/menaquinone biosynthesis C-methylase UbiE